MAVPATRDDFKEYCLRNLGKGMITINVTDAQAEDRIDEALQAWNQQHMDGSVEMYLQHTITSDDKTNKYIPVASTVMYVEKVLNIRDNSSTISMFDIRYQLHLNDIFDLNFAGALSNYVQTQQYIGLLDDTLNGEPEIQYALHGRKLYLHGDWNSIDVGDVILVKAYVNVDPETDTSAYNDRWLKAYATALIARQWGRNVGKFEGVQMIGGVTFTGGEIEAKADNEIDKLEEELKTKYSKPVDFFIG